MQAACPCRYPSGKCASKQLAAVGALLMPGMAADDTD
jgi:hypothetical protein